MLLNKYTNGVIFIDDKVEEVDFLMNYCKESNVNVLYNSPNDFNYDRLYYGYRIVFVDLAFDDGIPDFGRATNIIRGISDNGEKHLLVVAWTQHEKDIVKLKAEIERKMNDNLPIAILNGKKSRLLSLSTKEEFDILISEIFNDFFNSNTNLFNLLEWEKKSLMAVREELHNLIIKSYENEINPELVEKNLGLLAKNTLLPNDVLSSFEILNNKVNDNILSKITLIENSKIHYDSSSFTFVDKFKFNYEMIFSTILNSDDIPGSIYKIKEYSYDILKEAISKKQENDYTDYERLFSKLKDKDIIFRSISHIAVNCTPNCTFVNKKRNTTYFEGYIINDIKDYESKYCKLRDLKGFSSNSEDNCTYSYIDNSGVFSHIIICFTLCKYDISEDCEKYAQLKNSIKISIQQKYSSWVNRVGDNLNYN